MSLLEDLSSKVSMLNESERVEYNRRLQSAKATKELAASLSSDIQQLDGTVNLFSLISMTARTIFLTLFGAVFALELNSDARLIWLGALLVMAVIVLLVDIQKNSFSSQRATLQVQRSSVEREWAALGLEVSFLQAILEMEAAKLHSRAFKISVARKPSVSEHSPTTTTKSETRFWSTFRMRRTGGQKLTY